MNFKKIQKLVFEEYKDNGYYEFFQNLNLYKSGLGDLMEILKIHGEITECEIGFNKGELINSELADIIIRVMNYANRKNIDLEKAILEKNKYNHTRTKLHGKKVL